jgi:hypothetical protein
MCGDKLFFCLSVYKATWNVGILERWNIGHEKLDISVNAVKSIIPLFHNSILPIGTKSPIC